MDDDEQAPAAHARPLAIHQWLKVDRRGIKEGRLIDTFKYIWVAP